MSITNMLIHMMINMQICAKIFIPQIDYFLISRASTWVRAKMWIITNNFVFVDIYFLVIEMQFIKVFIKENEWRFIWSLTFKTLDFRIKVFSIKVYLNFPLHCKNLKKLNTGLNPTKGTTTPSHESQERVTLKKWSVTTGEMECEQIQAREEVTEVIIFCVASAL